MQYGHVNIFYTVHEDQLFLRIVGTVEKIMRTSFNFTFLTAAEVVKSILKIVFELVFSKMT